MRPVKKKQSGLNELPLFRSFTILLMELQTVVKNIEKDMKMVYGYEILRSTKALLTAMRKSFRNTDPNDKNRYALSALDFLDDVELTMKVLSDAKVVSVKQTASVSIRIADVKTQLEGWQRSLSKQIDNIGNQDGGPVA